MPKKYIQLLLSINFCLTTVAAIAKPDINSVENFILEEKREEKFLREQFDQIRRHLEEIYTIYPSLKQTFIPDYQTKEDEDIEEGSANLLSILKEKMVLFLDCQLAEPLETHNKNLIKIQIGKILELINIIDEFYNKNSKTLSKETQVFLRNQLSELFLLFSDTFLACLKEPLEENLNSEDSLYLAKRDVNSAFELIDKSSSSRIELDNQFSQISDCIDKISAIYRSKLLQEIISDHRKVKVPSDERLEKISEETLENQFFQLQESLKSCFEYQPREELSEDSKTKLGVQLKQIKHCLNTIYEIYESEKESLSEKEKAFLSDQLEELYNFFL